MGSVKMLARHTCSQSERERERRREGEGERKTIASKSREVRRQHPSLSISRRGVTKVLKQKSSPPEASTPWMPVRRTFVTFVPFPMTKSSVKQCTGRYCAAVRALGPRIPYAGAQCLPQTMWFNTGHIRGVRGGGGESVRCNWQMRLFRAIHTS